MLNKKHKKIKLYSNKLTSYFWVYFFLNMSFRWEGFWILPWSQKMRITALIIHTNPVHQLTHLYDLFITNTQLLKSCGLLWCFYQCLDSHSDGTHSLLSKWCKATFLQIWWRNKLIHILDGLRVSKYLANFYFGVNYTFNIHLKLNILERVFLKALKYKSNLFKTIPFRTAISLLPLLALHKKALFILVLCILLLLHCATTKQQQKTLALTICSDMCCNATSSIVHITTVN